MIWNLQFLVT